MRPRYALIVALLSIVGATASAELAWVHYKVHTDPGHRSLCAVSESLDCDAVAASPDATLLGVPNALWALLTYILLFALALRARFLERIPAANGAPPRPFPSEPRTWLFWASLGAAGYTAWLIAVSFLTLNTFCLFCAVLWLTNAALLVASLANVRGCAPLAGLARELAAIRRQPAPFLLTTAPFAALAVGFVLLVPRLYPAGPKLSDGVRLPAEAIPADAAARGPADAPHTLVVFSDYRCPHCRAADEAIERARHAAPERLRVVHLHFPLEDGCNPLLDRAFHPGACQAALAAECAREQGRFWDLHAALFRHEGRWTDETPFALAAALGLDRGALERCVKRGGDAEARVRRDVDLAARLGLDGTPMLFFDGREHAGPMTVPELLGLIGE